MLASPAYMERQNNPTPATREAMSSFRNMSRTVCDVAATSGVLKGSHVVTLRFPAPLADRAAATALINRLAQDDGIGRVHLWTASIDQTPPTHEMTLRAGPDALISGALVVECLRSGPAVRLGRSLTDAPPAVLGSAGHGAVGIYRFICAHERKAA